MEREYAPEVKREEGVKAEGIQGGGVKVEDEVKREEQGGDAKRVERQDTLLTRTLRREAFGRWDRW